VDEEGRVDYRGFLQDRTELTGYLDQLSKNAPNPETWSRDAQLAYWINAYNAYTIELILEHYPVQSIRDIGSKIMIPNIVSPWDIKFIEIGNEKYDLNNIEHSIIRKQFDEPRIHFAVICAAHSCPQLRNEAYTAKNLEQQLGEDARNFINDPSRNKIQTDKVQLSKLFSWYKGDFTKGMNLAEYVSQYAEVPVNDDARVSFLEYDWSLNEQKLE